MKKFAIVAAILVVAAAGLMQLQLATAQAPAATNQGQSSQEASAKSLLGNGGFEERQEHSNDPQEWFGTRLPDTAGHFLMASSSSVAHNGRRSVFVEIGESHPDRPVAYNWTAVANGWKPGETYELSGWIKVENAKEPAFIMAQFWDAESTPPTKEKPIGKRASMIGGATTQKDFPVTGTADWKRVSTRLTVPEGTKVVRVRIGLASQRNWGAKAWFDDVSLVKVAN